MPAPHQDHWLVRPGTIRRLWVVFGVILASLILADLFVQHHTHFGFGAWYGFAVCVVLVLFAKALGATLKRPDTYYDD